MNVNQQKNLQKIMLAFDKDYSLSEQLYVTDKRCAWNRDEVERWLDERQAASPAEFQGKKPPVQQRVYRPVSNAA